MSYCTTCGHPLDEESGFCSYCGAEHSADGEVALPGRPTGDLDTDGTVPIMPKSVDTVPMPTRPTGTSFTSPRVQTETGPARTDHEAAPIPQGRGRSRSRTVLVASILVIVVACGAAAAIVLLGRGSGSSAAAASPSPSPTQNTPTVVKIISPNDGSKVIGGQALRVFVRATDVVGMEQLQLAVNGRPTGPIKHHAGPDDSKTTSFPWRPPKKGGRVNLTAEVVLDDGSVVRSEVVSVTVQPAIRPTPTVTVTATAQAEPVPDYGSGEGGAGNGTGLLSTPCYVVLISSETNYAEAEDWFYKLLGAGWENAGILRSDDYNLIAGYYCPYVGPYNYESEADEALRALKAGKLGESPRIKHLDL